MGIKSKWNDVIKGSNIHHVGLAEAGRKRPSTHDRLAQRGHLFGRTPAPSRQSVCTVIGYHEQWYPDLLRR